jgi:hypothetical protein
LAKAKKLKGLTDQKEIDRHFNELMKLDKPQFMAGGPESYVVKVDREYNSQLVFIEQKGYSTPEQFTVMKFYSIVELIEKQARKQKEQIEKIKGRNR